MATKRLGKLKPRYTFMLNPHAEVRLSRCPRCDKLTYPRKFPLLIHIDDFGLMAMGKTCKYCSRCQMIICHQDELEGELANAFQQLAIDGTGREYFVIGTVETKPWRASLTGPAMEHDQLFAHTADFKKQTGVSITPGGWYPQGHEPKPLPAHRPQRIPRIVDASRG